MDESTVPNRLQEMPSTESYTATTSSTANKALRVPWKTGLLVVVITQLSRWAGVGSRGVSVSTLLLML